jgi:hypothetical protein
MTREDFMGLCERAADFCDVCKSCTITITKSDGEIVTLTVTNTTVTPMMTKKGGSHQLRELY